MFNPEKLLGGLLSGAIGGSRGIRRSGKAALAMGALGVAVAAVEHLMEKNQQHRQTTRTPAGSAPPPPPGSAAGKGAPPPPPPGPQPVAPAHTPASPQPEASDSVLLIRAMIASAYADGELDAGERSKILKRLDAAALDEEERAFIQTELDNPRDAADLVTAVQTPEMAQQVYAVSLMAVTVDSEAEKTYLNDLADRLKLTDGERAKVHSLLEIPLF